MSLTLTQTPRFADAIGALCTDFVVRAQYFDASNGAYLFTADSERMTLDAAEDMSDMLVFLAAESNRVTVRVSVRVDTFPESN